MKETGIIRRIDDLGRVVIPKQLRKDVFGTWETDGKPLEFFFEDDYIILKKYNGVENEWQD